MTRILALDHVDSTNAEAFRLATRGELGPLWVTAATQSAGKGRSGRAWGSEPGNLFASLLLTVAMPQPKAYQLSLVAGIATLEALRQALSPAPLPEAVRLKWPNDLMAGGAKLAGILVESAVTRDALTAVIGIGVNLVSHPEGLDRPATHVSAFTEDHRAPSPQTVLEALSASMEAWIGVWQEGRGFSLVRDAWLRAAHPLGERMSINTGQGPVSGTFQGLEPDGALQLLTEEGRLQSFSFGDVTLAAS